MSTNLRWGKYSATDQRPVQGCLNDTCPLHAIETGLSSGPMCRKVRKGHTYLFSKAKELLQGSE